ncbi:hypothetical protein [Lapillicoccus sp.]|uniref:hypothetical protein n=1 Tax=Lapillicoccus sp. TaxID=1909287 RepID=UPI0032647F5E
MSPRWRLADQPRGRRRLIWLAVAYVVVLLALVGLGLSVSPILLGTLFLAGFAGAAFAIDRFAENQDDQWSTSQPSTAGLGRGSDHLTVALARRLSSTATDPRSRASLAGELHRQLRVVVVDRVRRERGFDLTSHPRAANDVLPTELVALVTGPPDPRLTDSRYLADLLDRIEST